MGVARGHLPVQKQGAPLPALLAGDTGSPSVDISQLNGVHTFWSAMLSMPQTIPTHLLLDLLDRVGDEDQAVEVGLDKHVADREFDQGYV